MDGSVTKRLLQTSGPLLEEKRRDDKMHKDVF